MNIESQTQLYPAASSIQEAAPQNCLGIHPILSNMFKDFAPHLLELTADDAALIQLIQHYLFEEAYLDFEPLEEQLQPEFFGALYGLKVLLQQYHTLDKVALQMKKSQDQFLDWSDKQFGT